MDKIVTGTAAASASVNDEAGDDGGGGGERGVLLDGLAGRAAAASDDDDGFAGRADGSLPLLCLRLCFSASASPPPALPPPPSTPPLPAGRESDDDGLGDHATSPECYAGGDRAGSSPLEAVLECFGAPPSASTALSLVARLRDGIPGPAATACDTRVLIASSSADDLTMRRCVPLPDRVLSKGERSGGPDRAETWWWGDAELVGLS